LYDDVPADAIAAVELPVSYEFESAGAAAAASCKQVKQVDK
jgi:hypothetical protein